MSQFGSYRFNEGDKPKGVRLKFRKGHIDPHAILNHVGEAAVQKVRMLLTGAEMEFLMRRAIQLAIYDHAPGEYYVRTGSLIEAIKSVSGENGVAVYIDPETLIGLTGKDYSGRTADPQGDPAFWPKSGQGYFSPAMQMIFSHLVKTVSESRAGKGMRIDTSRTQAP